MIGSLQTQYQGINMEDEINFDEMSEAEIDEILLYSQTQENLQERYECACQILANMIEDMEYDSYSNAEMVDMTICKMFIDGFINVEKKHRIYH
jgi:hypothetical protein